MSMVQCVNLDIYGLEGPTAVKKYFSTDVNGSIINLDTYGFEEKFVLISFRFHAIHS